MPQPYFLMSLLYLSLVALSLLASIRKHSVLDQSVLSWGRGNRTRLGLWILDPLQAPNFGGIVEEFPFWYQRVAEIQVVPIEE
jgi:hypothetical protein